MKRLFAASLIAFGAFLMLPVTTAVANVGFARLVFEMQSAVVVTQGRCVE